MTTETFAGFDCGKLNNPLVQQPCFPWWGADFGESCFRVVPLAWTGLNLPGEAL